MGDNQFINHLIFKAVLGNFPKIEAKYTSVPRNPVSEAKLIDSEMFEKKIRNQTSARIKPFPLISAVSLLALGSALSRQDLGHLSDGDEARGVTLAGGWFHRGMWR